MRALIVEDESISARLLMRLLKSHAREINDVAVVNSVREAIAWLGENSPPDLVLLDVELADGSSFDLLATMPVTAPVIFVTAHSTHAVRAFDHAGVDYVLKPVDPARFCIALDRWRQHHLVSRTLNPGVTDSKTTPNREAFRQRLLVRRGEIWLPIDVADIAYFVRAPAVKLVTTAGRGHVHGQSLDELANVLDPRTFFRLNRQWLVHRQSIESISAGIKGRLEVHLRPRPAIDAPAAVVSQPRAAAFKNWLAE